MNDNDHQAVNGGTGANHIMLGTGDAIWFSDATGTTQMPPHNRLATNAGPANAGIVDEIENPNPQPGTNNDYVQDGYRGARLVRRPMAVNHIATAPTPPSQERRLLSQSSSVSSQPQLRVWALLPSQQLQSRLL
jgi:hypothetical protein